MYCLRNQRPTLLKEVKYTATSEHARSHPMANGYIPDLCRPGDPLLIAGIESVSQDEVRMVFCILQITTRDVDDCVMKGWNYILNHREQFVYIDTSEEHTHFSTFPDETYFVAEVYQAAIQMTVDPSLLYELVAYAQLYLPEY